MALNTIVRENIHMLTKKLGLSAFESKAYSCFFIKARCLTAKEVSKYTGIPLGRVYDVMSSLESKGLIRVDRLSNPIRYILNNPKQSLTILLNRKKEKMLRELEEDESLIEELSMYYDVELSNDNDDKNAEWHIYDVTYTTSFYDSILPSMIRYSSREVIIVGNNLIGTLSSNFLKEVIRGINRSVRFMGVTSIDSVKAFLALSSDEMLEKKSSIVKILQACNGSNMVEIKVSTNLNVTPFGIFDRTRVGFAIPSPLTGEYIVMIDTNKRSVVDEFYTIFEDIWKTSEYLDFNALL
jgi:HTH-type transcriptional regulator, sugar sensing transcriptional regulator